MANEQRLIDAIRLKEVLERYVNAPHVRMGCSYSGGMSTAINTCISFLDNQPTVDSVEVVRCKDCKSYVNRECKNLVRHMTNPCSIYTLPNDFCSYGERKDNERKAD